MFDVVALGEVLIDFTSSGQSPNGNVLFERNPGGAPANVLAALTKLGRSAAFIGKVGNDQFGFFLRDILKSSKIDVSGLRFSEEANTTLAFVHLDDRGERSFSFYRNPGADMLLCSDELDYGIIRNSRIFHFGSVSMTHEPARTATLSAARYAKDNGIVVSYDPNLRPPLWKSLEAAKAGIMQGLAYADILKISEEELWFITGTEDPEAGSSILADAGISIVLVTMGLKGCFYRYRGGTGKVHTYDTRVVDTTGAGDGFLGGFLYKICDMDFEAVNNLSKPEFEDIVKFGNAVGALAVTKKGAIPAMPDYAEVIACQNEIPELKPD